MRANVNDAQSAVTTSDLNAYVYLRSVLDLAAIRGSLARA